MLISHAHGQLGCNAVKLREKRKRYDEEHKDEIAAKAKDEALKRRRSQEEGKQREVIKRILKAQGSHYAVLMVCFRLPPCCLADSAYLSRPRPRRLLCCVVRVGSSMSQVPRNYRRNSFLLS